MICLQRLSRDLTCSSVTWDQLWNKVAKYKLKVKLCHSIGVDFSFNIFWYNNAIYLDIFIVNTCNIYSKHQWVYLLWRYMYIGNSIHPEIRILWFANTWFVELICLFSEQQALIRVFDLPWEVIWIDLNWNSGWIDLKIQIKCKSLALPNLINCTYQLPTIIMIFFPISMGLPMR